MFRTTGLPTRPARWTSGPRPRQDNVRSGSPPDTDAGSDGGHGSSLAAVTSWLCLGLGENDGDGVTLFDEPVQPASRTPTNASPANRGAVTGTRRPGSAT